MDFRPLTRRSLVKPVLPHHSRRLNLSVNNQPTVPQGTPPVGVRTGVQRPSSAHSPMSSLMQDLLAQSSFDKLIEGAMVPGTITEIRQNEVVVDIGGKAEGVIPAPPASRILRFLWQGRIDHKLLPPKRHGNRYPGKPSRPDPLEPGHAPAANLNRFTKHHGRPHPKTPRTIQCLIYNQRFLRLRMPRQTDYTILVTLVVAIKSGRWFGSKWRQVAHAR